MVTEKILLLADDLDIVIVAQDDAEMCSLQAARLLHANLCSQRRKASKAGLELLSQIEENIAHYEHEINELHAAATRLHALQEERDSLTFLQVHLKETNRRDAQKEAPHSSFSKKDIAVISALQGAGVNLLAFMYGRSPTVDLNSACNKLQISSDLRTVTWTAVSQGRPDHPYRFDYWDQALCSESFSSGQHYWEVDVENVADFCQLLR
ncbi:butyrophilin subfamily 2 member A2-like [Lethenteron reissneri]|uniref:butyrophilin subfamily 2 member A2-like n=1 Tax=Lethenteron reissneri TaxID=7753 RepID=UPI002AB756BE|nr:butyrophilin subfamily 2 member A2-like [Lethenteron reissneri]